MSKVISTFQPPTAVLFSTKCRFNGTEYLVTATIGAIQVYSLQPHGLELHSSIGICGSVIDLQPIAIQESSDSNLLVMLDHPEPELLFFTYDSKLVLAKQLSLYERGPRPAEFLNTVLVHPSGQLAVVSCYTSRLKIIKLELGEFLHEFDVTLPEANLLALSFLPAPDEYVLAILHIDHQERTQLLAREISLDEFELVPSVLLQPTVISSKMIPSPANQVPKLLPVRAEHHRDDESLPFRGGILVVGGRQIILYELASVGSQRKQRGKSMRTEKNKKDSDEAVASSAIAKEKARDKRKKKARATVEWPWSQVTACAPIPDTRRFLIGDIFGRIALLSIDSLNTHGLILIPLGEASPPMSITHLTGGVVYVGSFSGDAQTLKIMTAPHSSTELHTLPIPNDIKTMSQQVLSSKGKERMDTDMDVDSDSDVTHGCIIDTKGSFLQPLETYKNVAPINDAVLLQSPSDDQRQIVTCSGGVNGGSLNIIRTGADFEKLGRISDLANVTNIWPLKTQSDNPYHSHFVTSTLHSTQVFRIESAGVVASVEPTADSFVTDSPTLCVSNVTPLSSVTKTYPASSFVIQVTSKAVYLLEFNCGLDEFTLQNRWDVSSVGSSEIVAASINSSQVLLGLRGSRVVALVLQNDKLLLSANFTVQDEVSAISCLPIDPSKPNTEIVAIAHWRNQLTVYSLADKPKTLCTLSQLPAPAGSLLFYNFGSDTKENAHTYLLCGLMDGSVASFAWDDSQRLRDMKNVSLGTLPVCLSACQVNGKNAVFAAGTRASLLSWDKRHLTFSPVISRDTAAVASYHTQVFSSSLILCKPSEIIIGQVKDVKNLHIRSVPLGRDRPIKIVHDSVLHVFGIACNRAEPDRVGIPTTMTSSFRLLDDSSFTHLSQYNCDSNEEVVSLHYYRHPRGTSLFCLGTFVYNPEEVEPSEGRIIFLSTDRRHRNLQLEEMHSIAVKGCVFSLISVNNMIAAACNSSVILFRINHSDEVNSPSITVEKVGQWSHNYMVTQLAVYNDRLIVGDSMHSVSLISVSEEGSMKTIARDFIPLWPMAVEATDENSIIGANDGLNLFSFSLETHGGGRKSLKRDGFYHFGDVVSKIIRGSLGTLDVSTDVPALATHLLFTSSGRISVVVHVKDKELFRKLTDLQRNLGVIPDVHSGVGGISHARFRAPKNTRGRSDADEASFGFLDGDLLGQFLICEDEERVMAGEEGLTARINASVAEIRKVLEALQEMR